MLNNGREKKKQNKTKTKQKKKKKTYQLHGCLELEEVFYLRCQTQKQCYAASYASAVVFTAVDWLWLLRKAVVYNRITTRNYTNCEWSKNADLVASLASCALRNLTISQPNYHQNTSKYI